MRTGDEIPLIYEETYLPEDLFEGILDMDLTGSIYEIFTNTFNIELARCEQTIRAVNMKKNIASLFGLKKHAAALYMESVTYNDRNMTFDYNGSWRTDVTDVISSSFSWGGQVYEEYSWRLNGFDSEFAGPGEQLLGDGTDPGINENRLTVRSGGFFLQEQVGFGDRFKVFVCLQFTTQ